MSDLPSYVYEVWRMRDKFCKDMAKRADSIRKTAFPKHTDPYSRHLHIMADYLAKGKKYAMIDEEPEHVAGSILATIGNLWETRQKLAENALKLNEVRAQLEWGRQFHGHTELFKRIEVVLRDD